MITTIPRSASRTQMVSLPSHPPAICVYTNQSKILRQIVISRHWFKSIALQISTQATAVSKSPTRHPVSRQATTQRCKLFTAPIGTLPTIKHSMPARTSRSSQRLTLTLPFLASTQPSQATMTKRPVRRLIQVQLPPIYIPHPMPLMARKKQVVLRN
jgi:hypothetical protein